MQIDFTFYPRIWDPPIVLTEKHHIQICVAKTKVLLLCKSCLAYCWSYCPIYVLLLLSPAHCHNRENITFCLISPFYAMNSVFCIECESKIQTCWVWYFYQAITHQINMEKMHEWVKWKVFAYIPKDKEHRCSIRGRQLSLPSPY